MSDDSLQIDERLSHPACVGLQVDVLVSSSSLPSHLLLERWQLGSAGGATGLDRLDTALDQRQFAAALSRLRLLLRNVYASARMLPAATLQRIALVPMRIVCVSCFFLGGGSVWFLGESHQCGTP